MASSVWHLKLLWLAPRLHQALPAEPVPQLAEVPTPSPLRGNTEVPADPNRLDSNLSCKMTSYALCKKSGGAR